MRPSEGGREGGRERERERERESGMGVGGGRRSEGRAVHEQAQMYNNIITHKYAHHKTSTSRQPKRSWEFNRK